MDFEPLSLEKIIQNSREDFVPLELDLQDGISSQILDIGFPKGMTTIIVDLSEEDSIAKIDGNKVFLKFNGRFSLTDKTSDLSWEKAVKSWAENEGIEIHTDASSKTIAKFTLIVAAINIPEITESSENEKPKEESAQNPTKEPAEEESVVEEPEEKPEEESVVKEPEKPKKEEENK